MFFTSPFMRFYDIVKFYNIKFKKSIKLELERVPNIQANLVQLTTLILLYLNFHDKTSLLHTVEASHREIEP